MTVSRMTPVELFNSENAQRKTTQLTYATEYNTRRKLYADSVVSFDTRSVNEAPLFHRSRTRFQTQCVCHFGGGDDDWRGGEMKSLNRHNPITF